MPGSIDDDAGDRPERRPDVPHRAAHGLLGRRRARLGPRQAGLPPQVGGRVLQGVPIARRDLQPARLRAQLLVARPSRTEVRPRRGVQYLDILPGRALLRLRHPQARVWRVLAQVAVGQPHPPEGPARGPQDVPDDHAPRAAQDLAVGRRRGHLDRADAGRGAVDERRARARRRSDRLGAARRQVAETVVREARAVHRLIAGLE